MAEGETRKIFVYLPDESRPGPREGGRARVEFSAVSCLSSSSFSHHLHTRVCTSWKSVA